MLKLTSTIMMSQALNLLRANISNKFCHSLRCIFEGSFNCSAPVSSRLLHLTPLNHDRIADHKRRAIKDDLKSEKHRMFAEGDGSFILKSTESSVFPTEKTYTTLFDGVMFKDLPVVNVKASKNNTILSVQDAKGVVHFTRSCGCDGFKNARKRSNVAAQTTGFVFGKKIVQRGFKTVRARVQGIGIGRLSSLKGISLSGVNIVSLTDNTPVSWNPPRAKKIRRV